MTANDIWWPGQLEEVSRQASSYLRRRFPRIAEAHEDISSEAKTQLAEQITKNPSNYPKTWFGTGPTPGTEDQADFFQLAQTILRRRIADHFRTQTLECHRETDIEEVHQSLESSVSKEMLDLTVS